MLHRPYGPFVYSVFKLCIAQCPVPVLSSSPGVGFGAFGIRGLWLCATLGQRIGWGCPPHAAAETRNGSGSRVLTPACPPVYNMQRVSPALSWNKLPTLALFSIPTMPGNASQDHCPKSQKEASGVDTVSFPYRSHGKAAVPCSSYHLIQ